MPTDLLPFPAPVLRPAPDPAFDALPRLRRLRDALLVARPARRSRWGEPAVFFFDPARQAELVAARSEPVSPPDPLAELIEAELPALLASVEVRRAARGVPGLRESASASPHPAARELAALLALPDDETIIVIRPDARSGVRVRARGVADVSQFHVLLADAAAEALGCPRPPERFVAACSAVAPVVPVVAEGHFQMFRPSAVQPDGSLPPGFRGSDHWLWPTEPLAAVPRIDGERVVLVGEPAFRQTWEVERRFPALAAGVKLLGVLSSFVVAGWLGRFAGRPVAAGVEPRAARAAA